MPKIYIKNSPNNTVYWVEYWEPTLFYNGKVIAVSDAIAKAIFKEDYIIYKKPDRKRRKR